MLNDLALLLAIPERKVGAGQVVMARIAWAIHMIQWLLQKVAGMSIPANQQKLP